MAPHRGCHEDDAGAASKLREDRNVKWMREQRERDLPRPTPFCRADLRLVC
jgi:hypothetical protein